MATDSTSRNNPERISKLRDHARELISHLDALEAMGPADRRHSAAGAETETAIVRLVGWMHERPGVSRHRRRRGEID